MIDILKYAFLPEAPRTPFKSVSLKELIEALISKRLRDRARPAPTKKKVQAPFQNRFVWARRRRHPIISRAERICEAQILGDLRSGTLIAHVVHEPSGLFRKIPREYWSERFAGVALMGSLVELTEEKSIPGELLGRSILVLEEFARPWLSRCQINENNSAFPDALRTSRNLKSLKPVRKRRASQVKTWCIATSVKILEERGGLSPNFKKADLARMLLDQKPPYWNDEEPGESSIKRYVNEAVEQFRSNCSGKLGAK